MRSPVLLLSLIVHAALAQDPAPPSIRFDGRTITRVEFEPPDQPLPRDELDRLIPLRSGLPLNAEDVRIAIQKLYSTGRFTNVVVDVEPAENGVSLRIITELAWFIGGVTFEGISDPPNRGQLGTAVKLELGAPFGEPDIKQAVENLQERLRSNGLYNATIIPQVRRDAKTEEAMIHFSLEPGPRARFDGVNVSGKFDAPLNKVIRQTHWRRGIGPFHFNFLGWRHATETRVLSGIQSLRQYFQKEDHLQARVTMERIEYHSDTNRVTPHLAVDIGPVLEVRVKGAKVSTGRLKQLIPIYQERSVDRSLLMEGKRNLTEYFESQGYFDAEVDFTEATATDGHQLIEYSVERKARHKVASLEITGNRFFDRETLRERLSVTPAQFPRFRHGRYSQKLAERDKTAIRDLYRSNGFREAQVVAKVADDVSGKLGRIAVIYQVKEGPQSFVEKLDLEGMGPSDLDNLKPDLQSTEGQAFSESNVAADRDTILNYYFNNGYPNATFDWTQTPAAEPNRVNLQYKVQSGERQYVRGVLVRGLSTTNPGLVGSRFILHAGEPISQRKIAQSQQKLYDLGIFSKVQTALQNPDGAEESKYVILHLDEASRYSFSAGFGAELGRIGGGTTTFEDPAGTTGFSPRVSLGISRINFLGLGHTISLQTRVSTLQRRGLLSYVAPQFTGNENLSLTFSALFDDSRDVRTFSAKRLEGSVQLAQRLTKANSIQYRLTFRRVTIDQNSLKISPGLIPILSSPVRVGLAAVSFIQDRRDDPVNSHRGIYNTIDLGIALRALGSETEFTRVLLRNSTYHPLTKTLVLARSLQFGYIQRFGGRPDIPLAERFFSGGSTSNRAFPDNQAGPRDLDTGFPLGGTALLFHSTELRFPLIGDNLGGVLFHDMGNVYSDVGNISFRYNQRGLQDFDYMVHDTGFGIRYNTPVGPIRADFGLGLNSPRFFGFQGTRDELLAGQGKLVNQRINVFQFHFSLGQTF
ncbi:MAG TPA: BamA/TamA family outer membrane protein [Bryobacteraceae bacterium]|nr:BamA/TamA family outer membrane protein [Bryobacteraceae bacterium]